MYGLKISVVLVSSFIDNEREQWSVGITF